MDNNSLIVPLQVIRLIYTFIYISVDLFGFIFKILIVVFVSVYF